MGVEIAGEGVGEPVRATVSLPPDLWRRARVRAVDERSSLQALLLRGLELALAEEDGLRER